MPQPNRLPAEGFVRLRDIIGPTGLIPVSRSSWYAGVLGRGRGVPDTCLLAMRGVGFLPYGPAEICLSVPQAALNDFASCGLAMFLQVSVRPGGEKESSNSRVGRHIGDRS